VKFPLCAKPTSPQLPALSVSMSTDSTLLVSGSADKSVKIWGLDFGDCHRSILAHQDSVTQVWSLEVKCFVID